MICISLVFYAHVLSFACFIQNIVYLYRNFIRTIFRRGTNSIQCSELIHRVTLNWTVILNIPHTYILRRCLQFWYQEHVRLGCSGNRSHHKYSEDNLLYPINCTSLSAIFVWSVLTPTALEIWFHEETYCIYWLTHNCVDYCLIQIVSRHALTFATE